MKQQYLNSDNIAFALANLSQIVFEVTDACNLNCKYCAYGDLYNDYDNRENKMLPVEKAIRLIDYLAQFWNSDMHTSIKRKVFISFYGGEPLLNMPFVQTIVDYVENKVNCPNHNFLFSMTTNALLLHKYMDYLHEHRFVLLVSLDGNKENTSYRVDKAGNSIFNRIVNNVDVLKEKYPGYFEERVNFNAVLHNKNSVEEIYRFFKDKYDKIPSIGELNDVGIKEDKIDEFKRTYRNSHESLQQSEHYEEIERDMFIRSGSYQSVTLFLHQYSGFVFKDYTDLLFDRSTQKSLPTGTCLPFSKKMFITVNGKILPCERIGHQFALGEITDTEIKLDLEAIAEKYNAYYAKFENQCGKCKNTKSCIQCMFNVNDLEGKPVCHGYMNEERFHNYVNSQMQFLEKNPEAYKKIMEEVLVI
ncbi:radical SAM peptide maturase [Bacteroidia bacterium]|nr:radical SAM peptide maturase [Bacteroidia bacterium]